jgi:hypothetical protein
VALTNYVRRSPGPDPTPADRASPLVWPDLPDSGVTTAQESLSQDRSLTRCEFLTRPASVADQALPAPTPTPGPAPVELAVSRLALVDATTDQLIRSLESGSIVADATDGDAVRPSKGERGPRAPESQGPRASRC